MSGAHDQLTLTLSPTAAAPRPVDSGRRYLLVLEGTSSSLFPLPATGEVIIGRAEDADLRLADRSASRRHARLVLSGDSIQIVDLGSHNGTRVGGERIAAARSLGYGDVISICDVTLVLHREPPPPPRPALCDTALLRRRLDEEVQRCLRHGRPLGLLCVALQGVDPARVTPALPALLDELRLLEVAAWGDGAEILVMLPEVPPAERLPRAQALLGALGPLASTLSGGLAACPSDGGDAEALLSAARGAARSAPAGQVVSADQASSTLVVAGHSIVVADPVMQRLYALVERLAASPLPVLIQGETGAGKEIVATALHAWSPRRDRRMLALNCAALPEGLAESEIFGHEKGAFSGAVAQKPGLLESAAGGTVFLDELGDLPPGIQAKLLRALETQRILRVGGLREQEIDVRLVAATHRDLEAEIRAGRFRQDLYFRLSAARVVLPPLRDRRLELPLLARAFLRRACAQAQRPEIALSDAAMTRLLSHPWPGNLRELRNAMDYAAAVCAGATLLPEHLPPAVGGDPAPAPRPDPPAFRPIAEELRELERTRMAQALQAAGGVQVRAAELIDMPIRTFSMKARQYGLLPKKDD